MAFESFKKIKFTARTASAGTKYKEPYKKIPAVLREGRKAKKNGGFFDYDLVLQRIDPRSASGDPAKIHIEQDDVTKEIAVYMSNDIYREMYFNSNGDGLLQRKFTGTALTQISKSFFDQIGESIDNLVEVKGQKPAMLVAPFEPGSIGSGTDIIPPVTSSIKIAEAPGLAFNSSGQLRNRKIVYENSSSNFTNSHFFFNFKELDNDDNFGDAKQVAATNALVARGRSHLTRSFTSHFASNNPPSKEAFYYVQAKPVRKFSIEMTSSNSTASFFALTSSFSSSADFGVNSGSFMGKIIESSSNAPRFYNGTTPGGGGASGDGTDGKFLFVVQKSVIEGEGEFTLGEDNYGGDTGTNVAFTPNSLVVWYPPEYTYSNVRSASFYFTPYPENMNKLNTGATTKALVTGSISSSEDIGTGELRTLYWLNHTYTSSFTASFGNFTRHQLKAGHATQTNTHQLPYMNTSIRRFGQKGLETNASHLWKDSSLSIPADKGYYVHSASFSQESKNQMSASLGSANHTSSFFVYGSFTHPFVQALDSAIINYTASQEGEAGVGTNTFMSYHPIVSCIFLKRFDNEVFIFQPKDGQAVVSESVG